MKQDNSKEHLDLGIGNFKTSWGVHICGLYFTNKQRDDIIKGIMTEGARVKDAQLFVQEVHFQCKTVDILKNKSLEESAKLGRESSLSILDAKDFYDLDQPFKLEKMQTKWKEFYGLMQKKGSRNLRVMGMSPRGVDQAEFMNYESWINKFIHKKEIICVCLYDLNVYSGAVIMQVLQTHQYTISNGVVTENPFYMDPVKWFNQKNKLSRDINK